MTFSVMKYIASKQQHILKENVTYDGNYLKLSFKLYVMVTYLELETHIS